MPGTALHSVNKMIIINKIQSLSLSSVKEPDKETVASVVCKGAQESGCNSYSDAGDQNILSRRGDSRIWS